MKHSESMDQIAPALLAAQTDLDVGVKRNMRGNYGNYASLESVIEAVSEVYNTHGIVVLQFYEPSDPGHMALTTMLLHTSGQFISGTATCPLPKNDPQGYGSASTYLRRYSTLAASFMAAEDDDGKAASPHTTPQRTGGRQQAESVNHGSQPKGGKLTEKCIECHAPAGALHHGSKCSRFVRP